MLKRRSYRNADFVLMSLRCAVTLARASPDYGVCAGELRTITDVAASSERFDQRERRVADARIAACSRCRMGSRALAHDHRRLPALLGTWRNVGSRRGLRWNACAHVDG